VLFRRLKHIEWHYPDLILVDGGMGQINAALHALISYKLSIPVVGLAKRMETIIAPGPNGIYKSIRLPASSNARQVLQRIRDEAHRFANAYHRKLRDKNMI
jgi:excinuclease ABC subunit C